jgi:hypothetical protein
MIIVYVILFVVVVTVIGKIVNSRHSDRPTNRMRFFGLQSTASTVDREENPRHGDDGTSYGYRPGD